MTEVSYPRSGPPGSPGRNFTLPQWRNYHRRDTGVLGSANGSDRQVFADGSGPYIKRLPGARYIQGVYGADDDTWQGTVGANATSQWRIDRVVDQLDADGNIATVVVPGSASSTPTAPDLTQVEGGVWQEHLAYFRVKPAFTNVTGADAQVVDERRFMPVLVTPVSSEASRPASPRVDDEVRYANGRRERWNGTSWVDVTPALASSVGASAAFAPTIRTSSTSGTQWSLSVNVADYTVVSNYVDGSSSSVNGDAGPASGAPDVHFISPPTAPKVGYIGSLGTYTYVLTDGTPVASGDILFGYSGTYGRLAPGFTTAISRRLIANWHYPVA